MTNYDEITTQASAHRASLLKNAEQQRLVQSLEPLPTAPLFIRLARQFIAWGRRLQGKPQQRRLSVPPMPVSH